MKKYTAALFLIVINTQSNSQTLIGPYRTKQPHPLETDTNTIVGPYRPHPPKQKDPVKFSFLGPYRPARKVLNNGEEQIKRLSIAAGPTAGWWHCPKRTILDINSNADFIKNNDSSTIPGFFALVKRDIWHFEKPITLAVGANFNFAKKNNGIKTDYFDHDETTASLEIHQDVKSIRFSPVLEWTLEQRRHAISLWIAPCISFKTITQCKWWEKSSKAYIGKSIKAYNTNPFGECGANYTLGTQDNKQLFFGYTFLFGRVTLKKQILYTTPDANISDHIRREHLVSDTNSIFLAQDPKISYYAHTLSLGLAIEF